MYEQAEPVRTPQAGSGREQNNRSRAPYPDPPARRGNASGHVGCNAKIYEQAEPVRTPQAGSGREQNNRSRASYPDPPARRGNASGHVGCNAKIYEQAEPVRTPQAGSSREQNNRSRAPYPDPPARRGNASGHVGCNAKIYEQAEPVRTPQAGSGREQNNRSRASYPDPPARRGNASGHVGCNAKIYEQAEPVRTPQAGSGREQNVRPRAPYQDPPARRGNTRWHVGPGTKAWHRYQEEDTSNVYEKPETMELKNISGDAPHGTDTSTDADTTHPEDARVKSRRVCYIAVALAVVGTLVIVGIILLITISGTYNEEEDISRIPTTENTFNPVHGENQTGAMERPNENIGAVQCPILSPPLNGFMTGSNSYGDVVTFTCEPGYKLVGTSSLTCLPDGTWTGQSPTCAVRSLIVWAQSFAFEDPGFKTNDKYGRTYISINGQVSRMDKRTLKHKLHRGHYVFILNERTGAVLGKATIDTYWGGGGTAAARRLTTYLQGVEEDPGRYPADALMMSCRDTRNTEFTPLL
ncbi:hypothetical protein Bbelb_240370 [Branchiostoma belcheri]|nr:hypothetical protein Bbelb_240370 [Branchiostoma belcheri]